MFNFFRVNIQSLIERIKLWTGNIKTSFVYSMEKN